MYFLNLVKTYINILNFKFTITFMVIILFPCIVFSQESIIPLSENVSLLKTTHSKKSALLKSSLTLPFFDDFSYASTNNIYPDQQLWKDKNVYVNHSFGYNPVSIGVATFDILNENGQIYDIAGNALTFGADTLTSQPINLLGSTIGDSIYLSFYYQPGGFGEFPDDKDSLIVEFFSAKTNIWQKVWGVPGNSKLTTSPPFQIAFIKLSNPAWIDSAFQFRFINKGSLNTTNVPKGMRTNSDIWNIDYVYMNKNRNYKDSSFNDIAISEPVGTFLKTYRSIPWKHYQNFFYKAINDVFYLSIFNHSESSASVEDKIIVTDAYFNVSDEPISTAIDISGRSFSSFQENCPILKSDASDSALFMIKASIVTNRYDRKQNDTVISYHEFKNYYAYDDGSAEYGYGLKGSNIIGAMVAYKFDTYQSDTLTAVDIYFNRSFDDENIAYFNLYIWNEQNKRPGDSIGGKVECKPNFTSTAGQFVRFYLQEPVVVPTTFYVGWQQIDETFLNIGYDRNSPNNDKIFYNLSGNPLDWTMSSLNQKGALMIRPVYRNYVETSVKKQFTTKWMVYPNPATNYIKLTTKQTEKIYPYYEIQITDLSGKLYLRKFINANEAIDIHSLTSGMYIIKVKTASGNLSVLKLVKQ